MENLEKSKRKRWSREETLGFLECYLARKEEFEHPRRKRFAYANVLEDMVSKGFTDSNTTTLCLESKMRTLLNAYKASIDNNNRTGATPCNAPFMREMEDIFGDRSIIANKHTLHAGCRTIAVLEDSNLRNVQTVATSSAPCNLESDHSLSESSLSAPSNNKPRKHKKCSLRERYCNEKLKLKKESLKAKEAQRNETFKKMQALLKEKWQKDIEIEEKKIQLLKTILNRQPISSQPREN